MRKLLLVMISCAIVTFVGFATISSTMVEHPNQSGNTAALQLDLETRETLSAKHQLAICLWRADKYAESEKVLLDIAQIQERTLGPDAEPLVSTLHSLTHVYQDWQHYDEAEKIAEREVKIARKQYHPGAMIAGILENYASILRDKGKKPEALAAEKEAAELRVASHTRPEHPTHAKVIN